MAQSTLRRPTAGNSTARRQLQRELVVTAFETNLGWMSLAHHEALLAGIVFGHPSKRQACESLRRYLSRDGASQPDVDFLESEDQPMAITSLIDRLTIYASGEAVDFRDVCIDEQHLTEFGRRIVRACRRIPSGETRSYGELASVCGSPGAARAVGQVMARNRYPLVVPCHRVLAAGGQLGGFSAPQGINMKRQLLSLEAAAASDCLRS